MLENLYIEPLTIQIITYAVIAVVGLTIFSKARRIVKDKKEQLAKKKDSKDE